MFRPTRTAGTGDDEPSVPYRSLRPIGAGFAALFAVVLATAILTATHDHAANAATRPDAHGATVTVRDFLTSAVVDHATYLACQYLTPAAQTDVAALQGASTTCSDVLASSPATLFGLSSQGAIEHLSLRTTVHGATAEVVASARGRAPVTFVLQPTTAGDDVSFGAPATAWRIAGGQDTLFAAPAPPGSTTPST